MSYVALAHHLIGREVGVITVRALPRPQQFVVWRSGPHGKTRGTFVAMHPRRKKDHDAKFDIAHQYGHRASVWTPRTISVSALHERISRRALDRRLAVASIVGHQPEDSAPTSGGALVIAVEVAAYGALGQDTQNDSIPTHVTQSIK